MKRTIRANIHSPYTLHDMNVIAFEVTENGIVMTTQSGTVETFVPYGQPDGYVEFHDVQWEFLHRIGSITNVLLKYTMKGIWYLLQQNKLGSRGEISEKNK